MNTNLTENELHDTATEWFVRLQSEELTEQEKQRFFHWLAVDPAHQRAYIEIEKFWDSLAALEIESVIPLRKKTFLPRALAASVALFLVGIMVFFNISYQSTHFATAVGEQRNLVLSDGSQIILNTASTLSTDFNEQRRLVHLTKGEAFFDVAKDRSKPFIVQTSNGIVRVLGTQFNVLNAKKGSVVTVLEGSVGVTQDQDIHLAAQANFKPALQLESNQQVVITPEYLAQNPNRVDAHDVVAWREGQLVYNGESFARVLEDINRYFEGEIRAGDEALNNLQVIAVLQLQDKQTTLRALEEAFDVASVTVSDGLILLYPKK